MPVDSVYSTKSTISSPDHFCFHCLHFRLFQTESIEVFPQILSIPIPLQRNYQSLPILSSVFEVNHSLGMSLKYQIRMLNSIWDSLN